MKREPQLSALLVCIGVAVLAFLVNASSAAAQANGDTNSQNNNGRGDDDNGAFAVRQGPGTNTGDCPALPPATDDVTLPRVYCPYPPGLIPSDLTTESERVRREIRGREQEATQQAAALGPLVPPSPSQTLAGNGLRAVQGLGKLINYDENLSVFKNVACASCHMPYAGFSGPIPSVNKTMIAYPGSVHYRAGKRTAQRYTYSSYS